MKRMAALFAFAVVSATALTGCGGGDGGVTQTPFYTVNASTGSDMTGDGVTTPYKTITKALSMANSGDTVTVAPGMYDNILGERFPITIPRGVRLIGDEHNKGSGSSKTAIVGGGLLIGKLFDTVTVALSDDTIISGFTITNDNATAESSNGIAYIGALRKVTVMNNTITGNRNQGIWCQGGAGDNCAIRGNVIANNGVGIFFNGFVGYLVIAGIRIEKNIITNNNIGVECDDPTYLCDLGGGATGSIGRNELSKNGTDLWTNNSSTITIYARNNYWDHVPPTSGSGGDIYNSNASTIDTAGALLAP